MQLDLAFAALSDPTRRAILARLTKGSATVTELAAPHDFAQPTISKHLKVLEKAGLIEVERNAQKRPRRLAPAGLKAVADWIDPFRQQWEQKFDRLEQFVASPNEQDQVDEHLRKK